ncbi:MAG: phosphotransferase [Sphingomonadales bacterium]|nr:phosphotransferase [Sphingomonadales bacterium]MBU3994057.1 phosphotransferase [Alphaproteobacteria bacterium]
MTETTIIDWARGDRLGIDLPAHPGALLAGGPAFLTRALHASGGLSPDNKVAAITHFEEWQVGGTGAKAMFSVAYEREEPGLSHDLFAKFSRSFTDRTRDRVRFHMEPEVKLANLSRAPDFPIAVPKCVYADFQQASGTGVLITERIPFGQGAVEPHHHKCMDHLLPEPIEHYRALIATLGHFSGTHKSGRLGPSVERDFPFDLEQQIVNRRNHYDGPQLADRARRLANFIAQYPHLVPPHLADPAFLEGFCADAPLLIAQQDAISRFLLSRPEMIALCHWNANIDNAWFWREPDGRLQCGLIDWGSVGQMHVCQTIWGSLGGSEPDMLDWHLGELIDLFIAEYARAGGPALDRAELEQHLELFVITSGLGSMMIAPRAILSEVPDPGLAADRYDPVFTVNETARVQLKITVSFLNMWHRRDLGRLLRPDRAGPWRA